MSRCAICGGMLDRATHRCELCRGHRCRVCGEPIYQDESALYSGLGDRHIRCKLGPCARPVDMEVRGSHHAARIGM